jgi:hypothetical protein
MSKKFNIKEWQEKHLLKENTLGDLPSDKLIKMKWNPLKEGMWDSDEQAELAAVVANFKTAIVNAEAKEIWDTYKVLDDKVKAYVQKLDPQLPLSLA